MRGQFQPPTAPAPVPPLTEPLPSMHCDRPAQLPLQQSRLRFSDRLLCAASSAGIALILTGPVPPLLERSAHPVLPVAHVFNKPLHRAGPPS